MKHHLLRHAAGAVAVGTLAAAGVFALPTGTASWEPVTHGLTATAEQLLPATISQTRPARVVTTTVDKVGRPVVTVKEATSRRAATRLVEDAQETDDAVSVEIDAPVHALGAPTGPDPYRGQQWDFAKLRIADAWQKSTGAGITVAVIDTGVDAEHPDLAANVLSGYDAIADRAGVSTDGNGHGTHVAGTIAAVSGNNVGVSSVAPDVRILPIKVLDAKGSGRMSDTAEGIVWAADNGAQVINMSLGASVQVAAVTNAIAYARSKGITVVAAAGNSRTSGSPVSYPAADAGVIGVAATDASDDYASYSNAGSYVDVAAPGSAILSTYPTALASAYANLYGTSMASPHVAAVAALLKSHVSSLTPDQIESVLEKTSVDLGKAGFDNDYGHGRIDPVAALSAITPATAPTTAPAPSTAPTTAPATAPPATVPTTSMPTTSAPTTAPTITPTTAPTSVTPSPSTPRRKPLVISSVIRRDVGYGRTATVTFTVRVAGRAWTGEPASLCVAGAGAAFTCTKTTTSRTGTVVLSRTALVSFRAYLKVAETAATTAASSPTATFRVRAQATAHRTARGVMTVRLACAAGQTVQIQRKTSGTWKTVGKFAAVPTTRVSGLVKGQRYRVVVPGTAAVLGVATKAVTA